MQCPICETEAPGPGGGCAACGAPLGARTPAGEVARCSLCGERLWSMAETCVHCNARGYPALRPRMGDRSQKAPGTGS